MDIPQIQKTTSAKTYAYTETKKENIVNSSATVTGVNTSQIFRPRLGDSGYLAYLHVIDKLKLRFHSGPIDQLALSHKSPKELLNDMVFVLKNLGMECRIVANESTSFRIKVLKPALHDVVEDSMFHDSVRNPDVRSRTTYRLSTPSSSIYSQGSKSGILKFLGSFPVSLMNRIKYGSKWNHGFDGNEKRSQMYSTEADFEQIKFYIEIQKIKNLKGLFVIDFKRRQGDIWAFKRLYQELLPKFSLSESG